MSFCTKCGQKLEEGAQYCSNCGEKTEELIEDNELNRDTTLLLQDDQPNRDKTQLFQDSLHVSFLDKLKNRLIKLKGKVYSFSKSLMTKKVLTIFIVTLVLVAIGSFSYSQATKPERLRKEISLGNKYLAEGKYEAAVIEFKKAIKIEPKSVEARIGLAKAYIGLKKVDEAEKVLLEARKLDKMNADVVLLLADLWKDKKPKDLYAAVNEYMKQAVEPNINEKIKKLYQDMTAASLAPKASLLSGKYTDENSITFSTENMQPGVSFHYTLDGSEPSKNNGNIYTKPIPIGNGHTVIKVVTVNVIDIFGNKASFEYDIDVKYKDKIIALIKEAKAEYDKAEEGNQIGKYQQGAKAILLQSIQAAQAVVDKKTSTQGEVDAKLSELSNELSNFRKKKFKPSDKGALRSEIANARKILEASTEGQNDGQVKVGSKSILRNAIGKAEKVLNNDLATQQEVDNAVADLRNALKQFEQSRIRLIVNPDGTNFTYGYKTLMGDSTNKTFRGTFKVIKTGTAQLYSGYKDIYYGDTGTIEIQLIRDNNSVTVYATETWNKDSSGVHTLGKWYAEYDGTSNRFKLYPNTTGYTDKFEGTYVNGTMTGQMYLSRIGYCIDFTAK